MRQLNSIDIADDGQSAVMGGGVYVDEIIRGLDVKGKAASKPVMKEPKRQIS